MISLNDNEIRATHDYWNDLSDNAVERVRAIAQAQRKKYTKYLNGLKGDVVERDGEWFATFEIPLEVWEALLKEIS